MTRLLRHAFPSCLALLLSACDSSPTAPGVVSSFQVATPHGVVTVQAMADCPTSTEAEIRGEIGQGYRRAVREVSEAASVSELGKILDPDGIVPQFRSFDK